MESLDMSRGLSKRQRLILEILAGTTRETAMSNRDITFALIDRGEFGAVGKAQKAAQKPTTDDDQMYFVVWRAMNSLVERDEVRRTVKGVYAEAVDPAETDRRERAHVVFYLPRPKKGGR